MFDSFGLMTFTAHTKVGAFVEELRAGKLVASRCTSCGAQSFPPRADCEECRGAGFEWVEISGAATLLSHTTVHAAPTGFESMAPYALVLVELDEGGRALAIAGESLDLASLALGTKLQLVACSREVGGMMRDYYSVEETS
jgi:uncharacterized OB-fold protein